MSAGVSLLCRAECSDPACRGWHGLTLPLAEIDDCRRSAAAHNFDVHDGVPGQVAALDLVGPDEIARRLDVKPQTVSTWRWRKLLPKELAVVSNVPVWDWAAIRAWAEKTGRRV